MKNLKFGFLSLIMFTSLAFLTSCEIEETPIKPDLNPDHISESEIDSEMRLDIFLPENIASLNEEDIQTYINNMSNDELSNAAKDFIIMDYLNKSDKLIDFEMQIQENGTLQGVDLSESLNENNLTDLNSKLNLISNDNISYRCTVVCFWQLYCIRHHCSVYPRCISY